MSKKISPDDTKVLHRSAKEVFCSLGLLTASKTQRTFFPACRQAKSGRSGGCVGERMCIISAVKRQSRNNTVQI